MKSILYITFIGARAFYERKNRSIKDGIALAVTESDLVIDCDQKAWSDGVRPGDTLRQARIASPGCQVIRVHDKYSTETMKGILDALARVSPYIEPFGDGQGVFVDITPGQSFAEIIASFKGIAGETTGGDGFPFYRAFAGESGNKLLAKAACSYLSREYAEGRRIFPGKTSWGKVESGEGYFLASVDRGREKAFLSGAAIESLWPAPSEVLGDLRSLGLKKVKELREVPLAGLIRHIGDWAFLVKKWADGEDRSPVKALYPPPCILREVNYTEPVALVKEIFDPVLHSLAAELVEKGVGFKSLQLLVSGDFPAFSRERKFLRPVSSQDAMKTAVGMMLDEFSRECGGSAAPSVFGFTIHLREIAPVQPKPLSLLSDDAKAVKRAVPVALGLAIAGIEQKFGGEAVSWGRSEDRETGFTPEIARRERMLSMWDPMRPEFLLGGDEACQR
ncbi:MAG: hypothetical protein ACM3WU_08570 [Bacillota bacterium]